MKETLYQIWHSLRRRMIYLLSLNEDAASEHDVVAGIESGVEFRGAKLWILVLAVFLASLGLNTNSAAVIIGAMLISPLMGPIIGMGMGMGIYDFDLLKRSLRNYLISTLFSVVTATLYFLITPYSEVQSELLARTSPSIYDVLIALCGGLAGIIALGSKSQRTGNVIPGVAIATALMPPLCTVGFGIATGNWNYAAGAMYLFVINTIFISSATLVGARLIMRFHAKVHVDKAREARVRRWITILVVLTIVPAVILTIGMVRESYFNQKVNQFIQQEMHWPMTQVISHKNDFDNQSFSVMLIGSEVDSIELRMVREKMPFYGLEGVSMQVMQASSGMNEEEIMLMLDRNSKEQRNNEALLAQQQSDINELKRELDSYHQTEQIGRDMYDELRLLYPNVQSMSIGKGTYIVEQQDESRVMVRVVINSKMKAQEKERMLSWLKLRINQENIQIDVINE